MWDFIKTAASQSQPPPTGEAGLGINYLIFFIVLCVVGVIATMAVLTEAWAAGKRSVPSQILLYVGGSLLAYELFLFVSIMVR